MEIETLDEIRTSFRKATGRWPGVLIIDDLYVDDFVEEMIKYVTYVSISKTAREMVYEELLSCKFSYRGTLIVPESLAVFAIQGGGEDDEGDH